MNRSMIFTAILSALFLCSCTQNQTGTSPESGDRHATVLLQDGKKISGAVVKSSDTEITIVGDDKISHTIPMDSVKSIQYVDKMTVPAGANPASASVEKKALPPKNTQPASSRPAPDLIYEVATGTDIEVRAEETIDSSTGKEGQVFAGTIAKDVRDNTGKVAVPKGSSAEIVILSASKGGKIRGASDLVLALKSLTAHGKKYSVDSEEIVKERQGIGANKRTAEFTGGGAAVGALIGAIAGGGKGAAVGAASGAGAGALTQILTKGKSIKVPVETVLPFRLDKPLQITVAQ
jgi:hypothetical protein